MSFCSMDLSDIGRSPTRTPPCLRRAFPADSSNTGNARHVILIFSFFSESAISSMHSTQLVCPHITKLCW